MQHEENICVKYIIPYTVVYTICMHVFTYRYFLCMKLVACTTCMQTCIGVHEKMCTQIFNFASPELDPLNISDTIVI